METCMSYVLWQPTYLLAALSHCTTLAVVVVGNILLLQTVTSLGLFSVGKHLFLPATTPCYCCPTHATFLFVCHPTTYLPCLPGHGMAGQTYSWRQFLFYQPPHFALCHFVLCVPFLAVHALHWFARALHYKFPFMWAACSPLSCALLYS